MFAKISELSTIYYIILQKFDDDDDDAICKVTEFAPELVSRQEYGFFKFCSQEDL